MAEDILLRIAAATARRLETLKKEKSLSAVRREAEESPAPLDFREALARPGLAVIAELKQASPSKGLICPNFPQIYLEQAKAYAKGGAAAISVLTEPDFFLGSSLYLKKVHETVALPLLRKDFTIDEYQIYEAKTLGASAVLLICSLLKDSRLKDFSALAHELGLSALVEAHSEEEAEAALKAEATIIGVNNRNLRDFSVSPTHSLRLRSLIPSAVLFVAESGIERPEDVLPLKEAGAAAVLIGEALMKSPDPAGFIAAVQKGGFRA